MSRIQLVVLLSLSAACGKSGKSAGIEVFGTKPVPPGELAKIKPGMTQAQVKAAFPSAHPTPNHSGSPSLRVDSGYSNLDYDIVFYSDKDAVADVTVRTDKDLTSKLPTVWGPAQKSPMGDSWMNDADGYEVSVMEMPRHSDISYRLFRPLDAAYFGKTPGLPGAWKDVKLGAKKADIHVNDDDEPGPFGAQVSMDPRYSDDGELEALRVTVPANTGKIIEAAWGPGTKTGDETLTWFNEATGVRADLAGTQLRFEPFISYAKLFGTGPSDMGRVPVDLQGKTKEQVQAAFGPKAQSADNVLLGLPDTKTGAQQRPSIDCSFFSGTDCELRVPYDKNTAARDEMLAYLTKIWGAPTKTEKDTRWFKVGTRTIKVDDWGGELKLSVEPK